MFSTCNVWFTLLLKCQLFYWRAQYQSLLAYVLSISRFYSKLVFSPCLIGGQHLISAIDKLRMVSWLALLWESTRKYRDSVTKLEKSQHNGNNSIVLSRKTQVYTLGVTGISALHNETWYILQLCWTPNHHAWGLRNSK